MNILDENIIESQCNLLRSWRIPFRQIGIQVGRQGIKDIENLILKRNVWDQSFVFLMLDCQCGVFMQNYPFIMIGRRKIKFTEFLNI